MLDQQAAYFVGQALGTLQAGRQSYEPRARRQLTPQEASDRAHRMVGRAFQLYLQGGLTKEQAAQRISSLVQLFASLE